MEDNYSMWQRKEAEAERWLQKRPECAECGEPIQAEMAFRDDNGLLCECCHDAHMVYVEDYK